MPTVSSFPCMAFSHYQVHSLHSRVQFEIKPPQMPPDGLELNNLLFSMNGVFL